MFSKIITLENLIYVIIFSLPLYLIKLNLSFLKTNYLEVIISLLFLVYLFKYKPLKSVANLFSRYRKYVFSVSLVLLGLLIATLFNGNLLVGLGIIKSWFLIPILLVLIIADVFPRQKIINLFLTFYFSAFFVAITALIYLLLGHITYDGRLEAFFNSPNYLAMYLAPAILIAGIILERKDNLVKRKGVLFFVILSLVIILIAFYFTYSYATWFSTLLILGWLFLQEKRYYLKKILFMGVIIFLLLFSQFNTTKFSDLITFNPRSSLASRIMIWRSASKIISHNWFFGIGPGNFQQKYLDYQKFYPPYLEWAVPHPQSFYLTVWLYGGFLALIGFSSLFIFWFQDIIPIIKKTDLTVLLIMQGSILLVLIHGLVDTTYFKNDLAIIFWLNFLALKF